MVKFVTLKPVNLFKPRTREVGQWSFFFVGETRREGQTLHCGCLIVSNGRGRKSHLMQSRLPFNIELDFFVLQYIDVVLGECIEVSN